MSLPNIFWLQSQPRYLKVTIGTNIQDLMLSVLVFSLTRLLPPPFPSLLLLCWKCVPCAHIAILSQKQATLEKIKMQDSQLKEVFFSLG